MEALAAIVWALGEVGGGGLDGAASLADITWDARSCRLRSQMTPRFQDTLKIKLSIQIINPFHSKILNKLLLARLYVYKLR